MALPGTYAPASITVRVIGRSLALEDVAQRISEENVNTYNVQDLVIRSVKV
jgi:hypothetical protein